MCLFPDLRSQGICAEGTVEKTLELIGDLVIAASLCDLGYAWRQQSRHTGSFPLKDENAHLDLLGFFLETMKLKCTLDDMNKRLISCLRLGLPNGGEYQRQSKQSPWVP